MAYTKYENKNFKPQRLAQIEQANEILEEYAEQGMVPTLRQLYYQHVARGLIENRQTEYNRLGELCRDARMAGLMDWNHLIDRTRNIQSWRTYRTPQDAVGELAKQYARDLWAPQKKRLEVWIEKDAAIGVVDGVCRENSVPYFSCRGFTSMSEMHEAAQRLRYHIEQGSQVKILHIGDHDPSGVDMSRDIEDRLRTFMTVDWRGLHDRSARTRGEIKDSQREVMRENGSEIEDWEDPFSIKRIALNHDQVLQYNPPPNPVKTTDSRFRSYQEATGLDESWELDALEPTVLAGLIQDEIDAVRDEDVWATEEHQQEVERVTLKGIEGWWDEVSNFVANAGEPPKREAEEEPS